MRLPRPRSPLLPSLLTLLLVVLSTVPALAAVGGGENTECGAGYTFFTKFDDLGSSYAIGDVLGPQDGVTVTVTAIAVESDGDTTGEITGFTWLSSTTPIDKVILKAGSADTTVLYTDAMSGGPILSPVNPTNQQPIGASHITFCTEDETVPVPADLTVSKVLEGHKVPAGDFEFTATCGAVTETFSLAAGEDWSWNTDGTAADLTEGVTCTVVETVDQGAKEVSATFNGAAYTLGDSVTLVAGDNTVVVTNRLGGDGTHKADLIVSKIVTGNAVPDPLPTFDFTVTCGTLTETFSLADGESWSWNDDSGEHHLKGAGKGEDCTVTETVPAGASASALLNGVAYTLGDTIELATGDNTVVVTNDYTTGGPTAADLVVTKAVTGNATPAAGTLFGFSATCGAVTQTFSLAAGGTWSWNTDGTAADLVAGATCAVSETASNGATSVSATFNTVSYTLGQTVALVAGTNTVATVNTFTSTPFVPPEPQPQTQAPVLRPAIAVDKSADAASYTVGDLITYTYVITNVGETTLSSLTLIDDVLGDLSDEITVTSLAPGEATTVTVTQTATDVGSLTNVGAVTGRSPSGERVAADDVVTVAVAEVAGVVIVKPTPEPAPGPQPAPEPAPVPEEPEVAPVAEVAAQELPRTGAPGVELLALALLSLATGAVVLRGRRSDG